MDNKELLKITHVGGGVCSAELLCDTEHEQQMVGAALMSLMDKDKAFADVLVRAAGIYVLNKRGLTIANKAAIEAAKKKTQN